MEQGDIFHQWNIHALRYPSPVLVFMPQLCYLCLYALVDFFIQVWIVFGDPDGYVSGGIHDGGICTYIEQLEVEKTTLLSALDVARTPQSQVGLSNLKSIGGSDHGGYAFAAFL